MNRRTALCLSALAALCAAPKAWASPVKWHQSSVDVVVDESLEDAGLHGTPAALQAGMAWASVSDATPELTLKTGEAGPIGYTPGGKNENSIRFESEGCPEVKGALAVTVRTYNTKTGVLLDADIVINGQHRFRKLKGEAPKKKNAPVAYDLQNTMTHEMGHFLGLGEDYDHEHATMYAYTKPGEVKKRVPGPEDLEQLFTLYDAQSEEAETGAQGCSVALGRSAGAMGFWVLALGMIPFVSRRRRRRAGLSLSLAGCVVAVALPSLGDTPIASLGVAYEAQLRVDSVVAHFEGGVIVSEMQLVPESCEGQCADVPRHITVYGGEVGEIGQTVGHVPTPRLGQQVIVRAVDSQESGRHIEVAPLAVETAHPMSK